MNILGGLLAGPFIDLIKDVGSSVYYDFKEGKVHDLSSFGDSLIKGGKKALGFAPPIYGGAVKSFLSPSKSNNSLVAVPTEPVVFGIPGASQALVTPTAANSITAGKRRRRRYKM